MPHGPEGPWGDIKCILFTLEILQKILSVKFCDAPAGIESSFHTDRRTEEGQTDMEVELVI